MSTILEFDTYDFRFPTSTDLDGSDAMNPSPDYSAAYVVIAGLPVTSGRSAGAWADCPRDRASHPLAAL